MREIEKIKNRFEYIKKNAVNGQLVSENDPGYILFLVERIEMHLAAIRRELEN